MAVTSPGLSCHPASAASVAAADRSLSCPGLSLAAGSTAEGVGTQSDSRLCHSAAGGEHKNIWPGEAPGRRGAEGAPAAAPDGRGRAGFKTRAAAVEEDGQRPSAGEACRVQPGDVGPAECSPRLWGLRTWGALSTQCLLSRPLRCPHCRLSCSVSSRHIRKWFHTPPWGNGLHFTVPGSEFQCPRDIPEKQVSTTLTFELCGAFQKIMSPNLGKEQVSESCKKRFLFKCF